MKKLLSLSFLMILLSLMGITSESYSQQRNPVLEFCTGTWCQYCPDGDAIIENQIKPSIPNSIILAYHGPANSSNDPFSFFPGNTIIGAFGFNAYPTGIVDRTTGIISRSAWLYQMTTRNGVPATVSIDMSRTFDKQSRLFEATVNLTALTDLNGEYKFNVVLLEDGVVWPQVNGGNDYIHRDIVRSMMNGALGEEVINGTWNTNQTITKTVSYTVPVPPSPSPDIVFDSCRVAVLVYKVSAPLSSSAEIQQAEQWTLIPPDYVATAAQTSPDVLADNTTIADFDVVIHNIGFQTDKYDLDLTFDGPAGWGLEYTDENGTYPMGVIDSVEVASGDSTVVTVHVNPNGIDGYGISTMNFTSRFLPSNHGSVNLKNVTTTGVNVLVFDANENEYEAYIDSSVQRVYTGSYGIISRNALMNSPVDLSHFYVIVWSTGTTAPVFYQQDVNALQTYLDGGGNLLINGQDIGSDIFLPGGQSQYAQDFYHNYLHADFVQDTAGGGYYIYGIPADPIGDGIVFILRATIHDRSADQIAPHDADATPFLQAGTSQTIFVGLKSDAADYRVVYSSIGLEQMPADIRDTVTARSIRWLMENVVVGTEPNPGISPVTFSLDQNYPNPFNPGTKIKYSIPSASKTKLVVYDVLGNEVAVLVNGEKPAGTFEVNFNAASLSSGVYFYKLQSGEFVQTRKMIVLK